MRQTFLFIHCIAFSLVSCSTKQTGDKTTTINIEQKIKDLSEKRTAFEANADLKSFLEYYDNQATVMPEYQLTLEGIAEIEVFYKTIFERQKIKTFRRKAMEIINLGNTLVEIGNFTKEYTDTSTDTVVTQKGKYWNVWRTGYDGDLKLKGEAYGYFHPIKDPGRLILRSNKTQPDETSILLQKTIPFELKAYNALMEKGVRNRDAKLRSAFFTVDGSFMPFADSTVSGMDNIIRYLTEYSSRGKVVIDSIQCYTYNYEYFEDYILEYDMFKVRWTRPEASGGTEGKGMRLWQRQPDKSLLLFREIGTHNQL